MNRRGGDEGFVMMDALIAVAILGLVGTGAMTLANSLLAGQDRQLDRSAALLMSELVARQYAEFGPDPSGARMEDGEFAYEVVASGAGQPGSRLRPMVVVVHETGGSRAEVLRFDFLAQAARS